MSTPSNHFYVTVDVLLLIGGTAIAYECRVGVLSDLRTHAPPSGRPHSLGPLLAGARRPLRVAPRLTVVSMVAAAVGAALLPRHLLATACSAGGDGGDSHAVGK